MLGGREKDFHSTPGSNAARTLWAVCSWVSLYAGKFSNIKLHSYVEHSFSPRRERPRVWASVLSTMFERNFV